MDGTLDRVVQPYARGVGCHNTSIGELRTSLQKVAGIDNDCVVYGRRRLAIAGASETNLTQ